MKTQRNKTQRVVNVRYPGASKVSRRVKVAYRSNTDLQHEVLTLIKGEFDIDVRFNTDIMSRKQVKKLLSLCHLLFWNALDR